MKRITLILALVVAVAMSAVAQPKKMSKEMQEKVFNGKAKMMQKELRLTDEQMVDFLPVYKAFQEDVLSIKPKRIEGDSLTSQKAYDRVVNRLEYHEKVIAVQKKAIKNLQPILTPKQLVKFLDAENKVQKGIRRFKNDRKGAPHMGKDSIGKKHRPHRDKKHAFRKPMRNGEKGGNPTPETKE